MAQSTRNPGIAAKREVRLTDAADFASDAPFPEEPVRDGDDTAPVPRFQPEFRNIVEHSAVGAYLVQGDRFIYVNPKLAEILGYSRGELIALESVSAVVAPSDQKRVRANLRKASQGAPVETPYAYRAIRKGGEVVEVEVYESTLETGGRPAVVGTLLDITERRMAETQISERAYVDPLTKLPNRIRFMERLEVELAQARRHKRRLAIVFLDIDGFKFINDNWGHSAGDRLLQSLALRLKRGVREVDTVARISGDQFLVLVPELRQSEDIGGFAQKLLGLTRRPFETNEHGTLEVTASAGVATYPEDGQDAEALLRNADTAMHRAKQIGNNTFQLCTPELTAMALERLELQGGLRLAIDRNELVNHFQPLISIVTGRIVGFEALVRWEHPEKGLVMPGTFIPVAEETGLILPLGEFVLRDSCTRLKAWHATGLDLRISVNFSGRQFRERGLVQTVEKALEASGLEPRHLEVEITESIAMEGAEIVSANLSMLRSMGVGIAIDDFGTGYSSMSYLKSFPVTSLKIDRSFVTDLPTNPADAGIVRAIVEMAHGSKLTVIAEGVETQEQFQRLQQYGCDEMQGYWCSRPLTCQGVDKRLQEELQLWSPNA